MFISHKIHQKMAKYAYMYFMLYFIFSCSSQQYAHLQKIILIYFYV